MCDTVELSQQMQGQFISALLPGHTGHQQTQQPFVFRGVDARAGLQPMKCGIQTVSVRFLQRFRFKCQDSVICLTDGTDQLIPQPDRPRPDSAVCSLFDSIHVTVSGVGHQRLGGGRAVDTEYLIRQPEAAQVQQRQRTFSEL